MTERDTTFMNEKNAATDLVVHIIRYQPTGSVNRDDSGRPKESNIGGARRTRYSSQSRKRAVRELYEARTQDKSWRTKAHFDAIIDIAYSTYANGVTTFDSDVFGRICSQAYVALNSLTSGKSETPLKVEAAMRGAIVALLENPEVAKLIDAGELSCLTPAALRNLDDVKVAKDGKIPELSWAGKRAVIELAYNPAVAASLSVEAKSTLGDLTKTVLEFMGADEQNQLANAVIRAVMAEDPQTSIDIIGKRVGSLSVAMNGRTFANHLGGQIEAASSFGHAESTHEVEVESDYWSAVDDVLRHTSSGAGHISERGISNGVLLEQSSFNGPTLADNWTGFETDTASARLSEYFRAVIDAVPTGGSKNKASNNAPYVILVTEQFGSTSFGFETPVLPGENGGFLLPSAKRLADDHTALVQYDRDAIASSYVSGTGVMSKEVEFPEAEVVTKSALIEKMTAWAMSFAPSKNTNS